MSDIAIYPGIVETVWVAGSGSVPEFGPASAYAYDVRVNFPDGSRLCPKMVPVEERYPDTVNVVPLQAGRVVAVGAVAGQLQLMASEKLHVVPCGGAP
jgi:hypothetical protein